MNILFLAAALSALILFQFLHKRGAGFKKTAYLSAAAILWLCGAFGAASAKAVGSSLSSGAADNPGTLSVHYIDVGQGDATLVLCGEHAMLIDAGDNTKGTALQLYLTKQGVKKLDYLILTHPDADHIGGADVILTKFGVDTVFMSDYPEDTKTYQEVLDALNVKHMRYSTPEPGDTYTLGSADFTILAPLDRYEDSNDSSIALMLHHGGNSFLFTGDCGEEAEKDLISSGQTLSADVYQVGHHGSRSSSTQRFMNAVSPTWAVISCGKDNSYGHPTAEVLNRLRAMGVKVFRTDEQGSIIAVSDGSEITWNCAPSETWKSGEPTASSAGRPKKAVVAASASGTATASGNTSADSGKSAAQSSPASGENDKEKAASGAQTPADVGASSSGQAFATGSSPGAGLYIGNKNNGKLHLSSCSSLPLEKNQVIFNTREEAVAAGYSDPCKRCNP